MQSRFVRRVARSSPVLPGLALLLVFLTGAAPPALAQQAPIFELIIKDHRYEPAELTVPAGKSLILRVRNLDATAEEFESSALKIEKVIAGRGEGTIRLRALAPGRYDFVGEYHSATAKGTLVVEEARP